jgi:hypothetical protein
MGTFAKTFLDYWCNHAAFVEFSGFFFSFFPSSTTKCDHKEQGWMTYYIRNGELNQRSHVLGHFILAYTRQYDKYFNSNKIDRKSYNSNS